VGDDSSLEILVVAKELGGVVYTNNIVYQELLACLEKIF
jgi:hypothetical protein